MTLTGDVADLATRIAQEVNAVRAENAARIVARASRTTQVTTTSGPTERGVLWLPVSLRANRLYRISAVAVAWGSANNAYTELKLRHTTNGTVPTTASTQIAQAANPLPIAGIGFAVRVDGTFGVGGADLPNFRLLLTYGGSAGNNATMYGSPSAPIQVLVEDVGVDPGVVGTNL
jgi:hypothetical protein